VSTTLVSVVIPACDAERFVAEAIESALAQDHAAVEVIVVDDGSTDRTAEIVGGFEQVRHLRQENQGAGAARNAGVAVAAGEYVVLLDADDLLLPDCCSVVAEHLDLRPEVGVLLGRHEVLLEDGLDAPAWLLPAGPFGDPGGHHIEGATVRRAVFDDGGGFDPAYRTNEGVEWLSRLRRRGVTIEILDRKLHRYRIHRGNVDAGWIQRQGTLRALRSRIHESRSSP
jgi:glycosyltransferase involved in cell wall biosynthesis